ncbi:MAG: glycoside hydrolase family 43 protein [Blastocatellia bacterium]
MPAALQNAAATYRNPVYPAGCADPFVLKYLNEYWCYCTGWGHDGRCFGVLHSRDLQNWQEVGGALTPYDTAATCYWAPEVTYENGRFLMYYSVGNEELMQIRVAEAAHPAGPFTDCGVRLTTEDFAIDAHVFVDHDGTRYLFYATDFLTHTHIGTGTVCDRLLNPLQLAGTPRPVTRARYDWQVYDPQRASKGGVRWHTVEGPFVLTHKGHYYQMFSGGNWQNETYGASYAISDRVFRTDEWEQVADGQRVMPVLRTVLPASVGPGHNSAVRGPDNQQMFCVYHFWQPPERVLAIDRLDWVGERLTVLGPTVTPQPAPPAATFADFFACQDATGLGSQWRCAGSEWCCQAGMALQQSADVLAEAQCTVRAPHFIVEVNLRLSSATQHGAAGVKLCNEQGAEIAFELLPHALQISALGAPHETLRVVATLPLSAEFVPTVFHLLRVEVNGAHLRFMLDDKAVQWMGKTAVRFDSCALFTRRTAAAFAGFAFMAGWQDTFDEPQTNPAELGWQATAEDSEHWQISEKTLGYNGALPAPTTILKDCPATDYELVINAKLGTEVAPGQGYGFWPALDAAGAGPLLTVESGEAGWVLRCTGNSISEEWPLAAGFDPFIFQQFRLRKHGTTLTVQHEARELGTIPTPIQIKQIGLYANGVPVAFDMVRVSIAPEESGLHPPTNN